MIKMSSLGEANIFHLKPLINNFRCKISAISDYDPKKQILCLVSEENDILLRHTNESGIETLKLISWFRKSCRIIHDVGFDPSGAMLLVLCFDNTLHIVPALKLLDGNQTTTNTFSSTEITSFVIPFVGPHECPNSKTCPNNESSTTTLSSSPLRLSECTFERAQKEFHNENNSTNNHDENIMDIQTVPYTVLESDGRASSTTTSSSRKSSRQLKDIETNESVESFMNSTTCPYPICTVWWQTIDKRNRAVIGYSDGSICFVGLSPNCPFISNTIIESGAILKLFICRDNSLENVTLLINSSSKEQWKLLLEKKSMNYIFPGEASPNSSQYGDNNRDDWQFVMPVKGTNFSEPNSEIQHDEDVFCKSLSKDDALINNSPSNISSQKTNESEYQLSGVKSGLLPAAKARLASLRDLGTKKFIAFKMKMSDNKYKFDEYMSEDSLNSFAIMGSPAISPEILTTPAGPYFIVQNLRNTYLLSALHTYSDTLSVHSMDVSLIPLYLYKIPENCHEILISSNILYSIQMFDGNNKDGNIMADEKGKTGSKSLNAVGVISSAMASMRNGEEIEFNKSALLALFPFVGEKIINIHRMATFVSKRKSNVTNEESSDTLQYDEIRSPKNYIRYHRKFEPEEFCSQKDVEIMRNEFPEINYDPCIVVTNKNTYFIELNNESYAIFLNAAIAGLWNVCEEFCNTFDLSFIQCIEFAGDCLLRKKKVTQALLTYNVARIPPVRTALKLAMFGENYALMHLCAMALKSIHILKSRFPMNPYIKLVLKDAANRHSENISISLSYINEDDNNIVNDGKPCSDYIYVTDESANVPQISASSQFHLSNLLLITLSERAVKDKSYIPVWNFLVTNTKFHTNMASIVLCQSGLYSSAFLLAMIRGCCFDVFVGLVNIASQQFEWYSELNVLLYNLTESIFEECIIYLRHISVDYFTILQNRLIKIEESVLHRLEKQLSPFSPVFRPVVSYISCRILGERTNDKNNELLEFCRSFIETYLGIIMQLESLKMNQGNILNALNSFRLNYEENQFAINSSNFSPLSAGCSHSACVIDGCAYFWGSNGIPCVYNTKKYAELSDPPHIIKSLEILSELNLEIHVVKCGRQHSLILTNNGLYAFGSNNFYQLGIGKLMSVSLQPSLVSTFDGMNITLLEAGQYHNAVVADGKFYTWGWGVYGQLGHGDIENIPTPKRVPFFHDKKVIQASLGHAHSLVLCRNDGGLTELFVFGSNHFGQLGIKHSTGSLLEDKSPTKSVVPLKLELNQGNIKMIHTKFFTNLVVTDQNKLFTWGSSPQALRLANQIKRRSNAKQKIEESIKKEIQKRMETTELSNIACVDNVKVEDLGENSQNCARVSMTIHENNSTTEFAVNTNNKECDIEESMPSENIESSSWPPIPSFDSKEEMKNSFNETKEIEMKVFQTNLTENNSCSVDNVPKIEITLCPDKQPIDNNIDANSQLPEKNRTLIEDEPMDHMTPQLVNTSEVSGEILKISTGLFHYALISSTSLIYTWGKNLEHQLGTEDKDRKTVNKPSPLENIENPLYVECGADFTLVMTTDYVVKAFGGNTNGQCARDLGPPTDKTRSGTLFCLPTTKRLMRLEGQCVESPIDVNLPRPGIQMDAERARYLKNVPKFKPQYIIKSSLHQECESMKYSSTGTLQEFYIESDDLVSSIDNISFNNDDSLSSTILRIKSLSSNDLSEDENDIHNIILETEEQQIKKQHFRNYIHYCLYIFHGLYDADKICKFAYNNHEFNIRIQMLNYKYVDAFSLCLRECRNAQKSLNIFEYFTKDPSIVPMKREDLKFLIYKIFIHFITKNYDLNECENFFLSDLDYYLLELSYVMYFNNNNTELEQTLNRKFKNFLMQDISDNQNYNFENIDTIFNHLSIKFKATVCQRLLKVCEN